MAHKRPPVPMWTKYEYQKQKTNHYTGLDSLLKELLGERTKENGLFKQIDENESILQVVREIIEFNNKNPEAVPFRMFPRGGWAFSYHGNKKEAVDKLYADQQRIERDITALKTQIKLCVEHQHEIENRMHNYPTWRQKLEKQGQTEQKI